MEFKQHFKTGHLLGLQVVERLVQNVVIPLIRNQLVVLVDDREGIDEGGAQEGVHILWHVFPLARPILGPVGEVAHHFGGRSYSEEEKHKHNEQRERFGMNLT